jgi:hypothetical protein
MLFDFSIVSHVFSLWIANTDASVMQNNFVDFQNMMSFLYSEKCSRQFVRHIIENIEYYTLNSTWNSDTGVTPNELVLGGYGDSELAMIAKDPAVEEGIQLEVSSYARELEQAQFELLRRYQSCTKRSGFRLY